MFWVCVCVCVSVCILWGKREKTRVLGFEWLLSQWSHASVFEWGREGITMANNYILPQLVRLSWSYCCLLEIT